jgi:hypothetical protein
VFSPAVRTPRIRLRRLAAIAAAGLLTTGLALVATPAVAAENRAPVATPQSLTTTNPGSVLFELGGTDPDGDALTYSIVTPPAHGTFGSFAMYTYYVPDDGYTGPDSFTFTASDGALTSAPATVSITVVAAPPNATPVSTPPVVTTTRDTPVTFELTGTDPDGDEVFVAVGHDAAFGTLTGSGTTYTYTPAPGFVGADSFTYDVTDHNTTATYRVSVTVTQGSTPTHTPTVSPVFIGTTRNVPGSVALVGSDPDGDPLTYAVATPPQHGSVVISGSTATYTPAPGFSGSDPFTYTASDGVNVSAPATVDVAVLWGSDPATAVPPVLDTSVTTDQKKAAGRIVSPKLSTSGPQRLLLAFVSIDGPSAPTQTAAVTGGGLTWSLVSRANSTWGSAEVWQATAPFALTGAAVTARFGKSGYDGSLTVAAFASGTPASGAPTVGATASASGRGGSPTARITPSAGSLVWATGHDWTRAITPSALPGQTVQHAFVDRRIGDTFWTQRLTAPATGSAVDVGLTGVGTDRWQLAAVEVRSAPVAVPTLN